MSNQFLDELKEIQQGIVNVTNGMNSLSLLREKLKRDFELPELKAGLINLPKKIRETNFVALTKKNDLMEVEQSMKEREAEISFEVNSETAENGKAKFSNENARKTELTRRLAKDERYGSLKKQHLKTEWELWDKEGETEKLRRDFMARLALKDLIVAELNLYTK